MSKAHYRSLYGPTAGDLIRLADTSLSVIVEADDVGYGDEPIWGYAKNLRAGMTQDDRASRASELDVVIAGVVVIDPLLGIRKTNIGIKDGRVVGIGRAGSPSISDGVELIIGPHTMPVMGYGLIATAGGVDSHVHLLTPRLIPVALSAGVTTLITGGFEEPPFAMLQTLLALEAWPVNVGLQAGARTTDPQALVDLVEAGAIGFKVHEDYGATPEIIDHALAVADRHDVAVSLHTDGLNESCELEDTVRAIAGRAVHAYHVEGVGGGHIPNLMEIVGEANVICSSTTPTLPYGTATAREHLDMILLTHNGSANSEDDVAAARERIHPATMAAEGPLHELGAISIINSDSQGMGRIGETIRRTWQLAHVMKAWRTRPEGIGWHEPGAVARGQQSATPDTVGADADNDRVLRYLSKYTINPAITHGVADDVGTLAPGHLADVVLWRPTHFGVRPELILKSGYPAWGALGEGNASVERTEPLQYGSHWGGMARAPSFLAATFVSRASLDAGIAKALGDGRSLRETHGSRAVTRGSMLGNQYVPRVAVDPVDGSVTLNGRVLTSTPVEELPMNRRYFLA
jgi:urease subunit alpha